MTTITIDGKFSDIEIERNPYCDQTRLMRLVSLHWSENIEALQLIDININDEIACIIRQMLLRLENLSIVFCPWYDLQNSALEAPKLKELEFIGHIERIPKVNQKFRKLESISFTFATIKRSEFRRFLARNRQLKHINIVDCLDVDNDDDRKRECSFLESIAGNVRGLGLHLDMAPNYSDIGTSYARFRKLKALHLNVSLSSITSTLRRMGATGTPLKFLKLSFWVSHDRMLEDIFKFKKLICWSRWKYWGCS